MGILTMKNTIGTFDYISFKEFLEKIPPSESMVRPLLNYLLPFNYTPEEVKTILAATSAIDIELEEQEQFEKLYRTMYAKNN